jgi:hypothetical protein
MKMDFPMMGMTLPPGMAQLFDALPAPDVMKDVSGRLKSTELDNDAAVAKFLDMLSQILIQNGLVEQAKEQTEPLKLECSECHKQFAVDNAFQYYRRVEEGWLYACADEHEPTILGSGRLGELNDIEGTTSEGQYEVNVIFPADYGQTEADNTN